MRPSKGTLVYFKMIIVHSSNHRHIFVIIFNLKSNGTSGDLSLMLKSARRYKMVVSHNFWVIFTFIDTSKHK